MVAVPACLDGHLRVYEGNDSAVGDRGGPPAKSQPSRLRLRRQRIGQQQRSLKEITRQERAKSPFEIFSKKIVFITSENAKKGSGSRYGLADFGTFSCSCWYCPVVSLFLFGRFFFGLGVFFVAVVAK